MEGFEIALYYRIRTNRRISLFVNSIEDLKQFFFLESLNCSGYGHVAKEFSDHVLNSSGRWCYDGEMSAIFKEEKELKTYMMREIRMAEQQRLNMKKTLEENTNVIKQFEQERTNHQIRLLKGRVEDIKHELRKVRSEIEEKSITSLKAEKKKLRKNSNRKLTN